MKTAQKTMKKWISHDKENQHSKEAHDNHPFSLHVGSLVPLSSYVISHVGLA